MSRSQHYSRSPHLEEKRQAFFTNSRNTDSNTNWLISDVSAIEQITKTLFLQISLIPPDEGMGPPIKRVNKIYFRVMHRLISELASILGCLINLKAIEQITKTLFLQISLIPPDEGMGPPIKSSSWGNRLKNTINNSCGSRRITIENDFSKMGSLAAETTWGLSDSIEAEK
nr:hypothetical protein [Tanacetum cinerariifolium]